MLPTVTVERIEQNGPVRVIRRGIRPVYRSLPQIDAEVRREFAKAQRRRIPSSRKPDLEELESR